MTTPEILAVLRTPLSQLPEVPRAAVAAAAEPARRDEVIPPLLESLRQAAEAAASGDAQHPFWTSPEHHLSLCALALLGQFRERAAAPLVRRLSSIPDPEVALQVWNDVWLPAQFLAATHDGNLAALQAIADDPALGEFDRVDALRAQATLAVWGELDPGEVIQTITAFFHRERPRGNPLLLALWLGLYQELDLRGLDQEIDAAWNNGEIDQLMIDWRGGSPAAAATAPADLARLQDENPETFAPITDAAELLAELPYGDDLIPAAPAAPDHPAVTGPPGELSTAEVLSYLSLLPDQLPALPRRALAAAAEPGRRAEIVPPLLRSLQDAVEAVDSGDEDHPFWDSPAFWLSLFALPLLAQFRERRAAPLVRRLAAVTDPDAWEAFWGDTFNGRLLAATHDGDTAALAAVAADSGLNEFARAGVLNALACLGIWGELDPGELTRHLTAFFHRERPRGNPLLLALWLVPYQDLGLHELDQEIDAAWNNGEIDQTITDWPGVPPAGEPTSAADWTRLPQEHPANYAPVTDAAAEVRFIAFGPRPDEASPTGDEFDAEPDAPLQPIVSGPKTGRNDPCPCGSGKKYKRCCGA